MKRWAAALAVLSLATAAHAQSILAPDQAERFAKGTFSEYLELLALPSDAAVPADIQRNAAWLETAFRKRSFATRQLASPATGGSSAYKGPITMFLGAVDALAAASLSTSVNVKLLLDSEDKKGSPRLHLVLKDNEALLRSDRLVVHDGACPSATGRA